MQSTIKTLNSNKPASTSTLVTKQAETNTTLWALQECFELKLSHSLSAEGLLHLFGSFTENLEHTNLCYDLSDWPSPITSQHSWVHHPIRLHEGMLPALCGSVVDRGLHTAGFTHFMFYKSSLWEHRASTTRSNSKWWWEWRLLHDTTPNNYI